jgi:hypothetical protein
MNYYYIQGFEDLKIKYDRVEIDVIMIKQEDLEPYDDEQPTILFKVNKSYVIYSTLNDYNKNIPIKDENSVIAAELLKTDREIIKEILNETFGWS